MDCLLYAFLIDESGQATQLPTDKIPSLPKSGEGFVWLHFDRLNPQTRKNFDR